MNVDSITNCRASDGRKLMFIWKEVLPEDIPRSCFPNGEDSLNPMCLVNSRINIHPDAFSMLSVAIVAKDSLGWKQAGEGGCPKEFLNMPMGSAEALGSYFVRGRARIARQCSFVDLAHENMELFVKRNAWIVMFGEVKSNVSNDDIGMITPFITTEVGDANELSIEHCRAAIKYRKITKFL